MPHRLGSPKSPRSSEPAALPDAAVFVEAVFQDFRKLMSSQETAAWLRKLSDLLQSTFCGRGLDAVDRFQLARRTHAIVSLAGFLGFADLARHCSALEEACHAGADLSLSFAAASVASHAALRTLDTLQSIGAS